MNKTEFSTAKNKSEERLAEQGKVWIVGAGPGDPELLTIKALNAINNADIIFYDNLVSSEIVELFPKRCTSFFVGKSKNNHSVAQERINQLLIKHARKGFKVCRVKGGDPFVFGRGSEEMLELSQENLRVEIIPGITAASGCSSYAGIPLTHRGISQGCTFVTGHAARKLNIEWEAIAKLNHTIVFYMGLSEAGTISGKLLEAGINRNIPVGIIENGTTPSQRVISTTLTELEDRVVKSKIQSPALIIIGETVELRSKLDWFSSVTEESQLKESTPQVAPLQASPLKQTA